MADNQRIKVDNTGLYNTRNNNVEELVNKNKFPTLSIICPYYNEKEIIEEAVNILIGKLDNLGIDYELIVVNDGCTDRTEEIVEKLTKEYPFLVAIGYNINKGRGYALRYGIRAAKGEIIITTEIDLSWGEDIIERLYKEIIENPQVDIIVASPHLPGGGYKNVPWKRVFFSKFGNKIIRTLMVNAATMNTGMTRAYRRDMIKNLPLEENHKEFHLEVILKAQALKYRISEIPCILEWKPYKHKGKKVNRKSSSKIKRLVVSHSLFSLFANPIRYVWGFSMTSLLFSAIFLTWSFIRLYLGLVSVYTLIISLSFGIIAIILFGFGLLAQQGNMIQRELWTLKQQMIVKETQIRLDE